MPAHKKSVQVHLEGGTAQGWILPDYLWKRLPLVNRSTQTTEGRLTGQRSQAGHSCLAEKKKTKKPSIMKSHIFIQTIDKPRKQKVYHDGLRVSHVR